MSLRAISVAVGIALLSGAAATLSLSCIGQGGAQERVRAKATFRDAQGRPVILRGIGWSPWHPDTGWARSPETEETDLRLLREAHVNCLRTWGALSPKYAAYWRERGFLLIAQVGAGWYKPGQGVPLTCFRGGKASTQPNYADPKAVAAFEKACREYAGKIGDSPNIILSLLGNEFSWVGKNEKGQYSHAGFDEITLAKFRERLAQRFGDVHTLNALCGTKYGGFAEIEPVGDPHMQYEWWIFLRSTFEDFMRAGYSALKEADPKRPVSYAKLMGRWDPCCEDAALRFLDVGGQNLYWEWDKDWARYCTLLKELIRHAGGRPVVITESGFQTWNDFAKEEAAARRMRQMLWNCFMHAEVAGVCPFLYNDEWYKDGDPKTQSPGESWGIVTARRQPKKTYAAVAEVYSEIEKLNDFLVRARGPAPSVALSSQDLDWVLAKDGGTKRFVEAARALYSRAVGFKMVNSEDLLHLDPAREPSLILCDSVLLRSPDGKTDAAKAVLDYVAQGGRVLYLSPTPFKTAYGATQVPPSLDVRDASCREQAWGKGTFRFVCDKELSSLGAAKKVEAFLGNLIASQTVTAVTTVPAESQLDIFVSVLETGDRMVLVVVNEGDRAVGSVTLRLGPESAGRDVSLIASDGAEMGVVGDRTGKAITLGRLGTHAVIGLDGR